MTMASDHPADLDCDGTVDVADFLKLLARPGALSGAAHEPNPTKGWQAEP
ncbi:MAG: hypothetical protein ACYTEI_13095 [Planctomycetota bacterium]